MKRLLAVLAAFVAGWVAYMVAMVATVYDGLISLVFQPFMAAIVSGLFVTGSLGLGFLLRMIPGVGRGWDSNRWIAALMVLGSLFALCFGYSLGFRETQLNSETGRSFVTLDGRVAISGYFLLIFAIANWPIRARDGAPG